MINPTLYASVNLPGNFTLRTDYTPRFDVYKRFDLDEKGNPQRAVDAAERQYDDFFSWQSNTTINWDKSFGEHRINFTGLYNAAQNKIMPTATNTTFPHLSEEMDFLDLAWPIFMETSLPYQQHGPSVMKILCKAERLTT